MNSLGEMTIAAHVAARKIVEMFMQPLISIAIAVTTFVSQNLGAKQYHRIREGMKKSVWISFGWVGIVILLSLDVYKRQVMVWEMVKMQHAVLV